MYLPFELRTPRLSLRPLTTEHTHALAKIYADPDIARYIGGDRLTQEAIDYQVNGFAEEWKELGYGQSAVFHNETGEFLGRIGLHYWSNWDEIELGYILGKSAQGQGFATEGSKAWIEWAEANENIPYIIANIHPDNSASIHRAEKLGFTYGRDDVTPSGLPTLIYRLNL